MFSCRFLAVLLLITLGGGSALAAEEYTDSLVGFSFAQLPGWELRPRAPYNGGPGTCVDLVEQTATAKVEFIAICGKPATTPAPRIAQVLNAGFANYVADTGNRFGAPITVRPGTPVAGTVGGNESLAVVLDWIRNSQQGASYIVWIQSGNTRLSLIAETSPENLERLVERVKPIRDSIRLP